MIDGLLFDKDGTLFDFEKTWGAWAHGFLSDLAKGDPDQTRILGAAIGYNTDNRSFLPNSPVIAGTPEEQIDLLLPHLPGWDFERLLDYGNDSAANAPLTEVVRLSPFLQGLKNRGLKLGIATNDAESSARAHLAMVGAHEVFDLILGFDSGYGGKPAPGMCLGFSDQMRIAPEKIAMIGDSTHDLHAGRTAGMVCVGVLTGPAVRSDLEPHADVVLNSIADLPDWLDHNG
ncbi:HAD family hydrolase [Litoreibacter roseus]|uniref:phosphoglycolate phosphatase n=1 Tax=Litoreibacter roseus TaxID=2601869 RepID=A0A6N6JGF9_9RHOB|nr:HAD family hydrolase [Litoreibacter roseus]GFE65423.1 phosphatase [Litoreibacter roseus]